MANRSINALDSIDELESNDLFCVWDDSQNTAVKMSGAQMTARLLELAEGNGGITSIVKTGTAGLVDTYTIYYANTDAQPTTFTVTNGEKGDTGDADCVFIKYAEVNPTSDDQMTDVPDDWMGIHVGLETSADDLHYTDYTWYEIKGPKGDGVSYTAQTGEVGLTRTYTMYTSDGTPVGSFSVTDGAGAVSLVNGISPDGDGDVSTVVGSVEDLGLTVGSATIAGAYAALLDKQVLICPATDFAVGELPQSGGNRLTDGSIEIVKGGTDGWIQYHARQDGADYKMPFTSLDVPSGTWVQLLPITFTGLTNLLVGFNSTGTTFYLRGIDASGNMYQIAASASNFRYEKNTGGSWSTVWTK